MKILRIFLLVILGSCAINTDFDEQLWFEKTKAYDTFLLYATHYDNENGKFYNPWLPREEVGAFTFLRYRLFSKKPEFPQFPIDNFSHVINDYDYLYDIRDSISFAGHASFIIKLGKTTIFTDPLLSDRAGIMSKEVKIPFDFSKVPERPIVLISHNHYDHLDVQSIEVLAEKDAVVICGLKLKKYFHELGVKEVYELDWWESITLDNIIYTFLPAQHWSLRFGQWSGETLWGSFIIKKENTTIYFSGDTGYFRGFEEYGRLYDIDYALLGMGAYEPRWFMHYAHMNVNEFLMAANELKAKTAIPMHLGVMQLGIEPMHYGLFELTNRLEKEPFENIKILRVGEVLEIN